MNKTKRIRTSTTVDPILKHICKAKGILLADILEEGIRSKIPNIAEEYEAAQSYLESLKKREARTGEAEVPPSA